MADVAMDVPAISRGPRRVTKSRGLPYARPAPRAAAAVPASTGGSTRLFVSNLHYEVIEQDLSKLFSSIGKLAKSPAIVFDRSGRSTGVAHIIYERHEDALRAKQRFDGQPARGQNISIRFEAALAPPNGIPTGPRNKSLLARIGANPNASLLDRLGVPSAAAAKPARAAAKPVPRGPAAGPGPIRAPRGNRPARANKPAAKPKAKTQTDLDKELDAYLAEDGPSEKAEEVPAETTDVDMVV